MAEDTLRLRTGTVLPTGNTEAVVGDGALVTPAKKKRPAGATDHLAKAKSPSDGAQAVLRPMSEVEAQATIRGHGQLLDRLIRALVQVSREAGQGPTLIAKLTKSLPDLERAIQTAPAAGAELGPCLEAVLALLGREPIDGAAQTLAQRLASIRTGLGEETNGGMYPIVSRRLSYDHHQEWGLVSTPTAQDSADLSNQIASLFPFLRPNALHGILEHVFDNVANYGVKGHVATGTVECGVKDGSVVIRVSNPLKGRDLPPTLRDRTFTPEDGVVAVPGSERDPKTGGGFGVQGVTQALPHAYHPLVKVSGHAAVSWQQLGDPGKEGGTVVFELSIPIPTPGEQVELRAKARRQAALKQAEAQARKILAKPPAPKAVATYVTQLKEVLQAAIPAYHDAPDILETLWVQRVFEALTALGTKASAAAPELRRCMIEDCSAFPAASALPKIEGPAERAETLRVLAEFLEHHGEQAPIGYSVESIASYVQDAASAQALLPGLTKMLDRGHAMHRIANALAAWAPDAVDEALLTRLLTGGQEGPGRPEERRQVALKLIGARSTVSETNLNLLLPLLAGPDGYQVGEALKGKSLGASAVPILAELLTAAAENQNALYPLGQVAQGLEPALLRPLIGPLFPLLSGKGAFNAQQMLAHIGLGPEHVPLLGKALEATAAAGHSIYGIGELIKGMDCDRRALKPILERLATAPEHSYTAKQVLEQIGS